MFKNKNILITGGTGSFGKCFTKELLKLNPNKIVIFSRDELKQSEMASSFNNNKLRFFIGDVRDKVRLSFAMDDIDYVVHAAALKQVPAAEYNPIECIKTNIIGAENVINACIENNIKNVIALSTDKAASPINIRRHQACFRQTICSKQHYWKKKNKIVVRYGNVFNSRGSVFPIFKKLIQDKAKYLPITDKRMTRFNLSLDEGVKFVIDPFLICGEGFIPKIPSMKIVDTLKQ